MRAAKGGRERREEVRRRREGEIVTPRRRVQQQGNERLPALHHAQGLPQSAGGRGEMPHVSGLLALLLLCMHLGLCVCVCLCVCVSSGSRSVCSRREKGNREFLIFTKEVKVYFIKLCFLSVQSVAVA